MKGIPIKFRGKRIDGNGYVYGDLEHKYSRDIWIDCFEVYPESVAQLVCYDVAGNEVYEGDQLEKVDELAEYYEPFKKRGGTIIAALSASFRVDWKSEPPAGWLTLEAQEEKSLNYWKNFKKV